MTKNNAPAPILPLPSARQLRWHQHEFYGFLHFTTNTFTDLEWGFGDESPTIFNPTDFDADKIAAIAAEVGMRGLILTCKHHDGFCLWPSKQTEHSVKNSPWRNGKGDVVKEMSEACTRHNLLFGVYLSPWDRNHADYGTPAYLDCYRAQLRELLTNYGPIFEVWHDGANGGDGYYGGANEKRTIDKTTYYDWENTWKMVRELQPDAVIFSDVGPDVRWCGNESGKGNKTTWMPLNTDGWCPGFCIPAELNTGHEDGDKWLPPEVDVSIRPGWFYHAREDHSVRTVQQLLDIYYQSVGCSAAFHLNIPPDRRGHIYETDAEHLRQYHKIIEATFAENLADNATLQASNTRGNDSEFSPQNVLDADSATYWACDDEVTSAELILDLDGEQTFNRLLIQEYIALGQRVRNWAADIDYGNGWQEIAEETTIGYKRILRLDNLTAKRLRIRIIAAKGCPAISAVGLYAAPVFAEDPVLVSDIEGTVRIETSEGVKLRYTLDGSQPSLESAVYTKPFSLPLGGQVIASIFATDNPDAIVPAKVVTVQQRFGLAKANWQLLDASSGCTAAIDADEQSFWESPENENCPHNLCIDLGTSQVVTGFSYLPRQRSRNATGFVEKFRFYVAETPDNWGQPVLEGQFDNIRNNPIAQLVDFPKTTGRYIRFEALSSADGGNRVNIAEFGIFVS